VIAEAESDSTFLLELLVRQGGMWASLGRAKHWDMNLATGDGETRARYAYEGTWGDLSGTWENCHVVTTWPAFQSEGVWHHLGGGGDFEGMKMHGTLFGPWGYPADVVGYIHDPHGE
jgi:hypothetical protein